MVEDPQNRRPEDPREIDELADRDGRESGLFAQNQEAEEPAQIEPPARPMPVPKQHDRKPSDQLITDDPGASASGYVSMLAKGQIGEPEPTSHRNIPMAREVPVTVVPTSAPPKLDPMRLPGPRPRPRRPWQMRIPTACYAVSVLLLVAGLWASAATVGIFTQQNLIPFFEWDNDASQLLAMMLLLCLPAAIILAMVGLYIKEKLTSR